jgi:hypothetical protein
MQMAQVGDDDGVLVIAARGALARRFAAREFDYAFPEELVRGAGAAELCAWQTEEEGEVTITVVVTSAPKTGSIQLGVVEVTAGDSLCFMPYSAYTQACSGRQGHTEDEAGRCVPLDVPPGRYAVWARRAPFQGPPELAAELPLVFNVSLCPTTEAAQARDDVPVLGRG